MTKNTFDPTYSYGASIRLLRRGVPFFAIILICLATGTGACGFAEQKRGNANKNADAYYMKAPANFTGNKLFPNYNGEELVLLPLPSLYKETVDSRIDHPKGQPQSTQPHLCLEATNPNYALYVEPSGEPTETEIGEPTPAADQQFDRGWLIALKSEVKERPVGWLRSLRATSECTCGIRNP